MRLLEMIERQTEQAQREGGRQFITLPGGPATLPVDADRQWRPAPNPVDGSLLQDPEFTLPTCAGPLAFRLFYDSNVAGTDSEWGFGRRASWPLLLRSDGTTVTVTHDDGTLRQYQKVGATFVVQGGNNGDALVQNGDGTWDETLGATGYQFHFPAGGYASLAYRANPQGMRLTCSYDASQRLQTVSEPAGNRLTLTYNSDGKVQTLEDWGNRGLIVLTYVGNNLTEEWEPEGRVTRYCQDSNHRLTGIYDPMGYCTSYSYDYAGRVLTRSVAGNLGQYTYSTSGGILNTVYTDPLGKVWTHLTSGGDPAGMIDPLGNRETYAYSNHQPQAFTNGLGCCTTHLYDTNGYDAGLIDPLGNRWTYVNDSYGNRLTEQNPLGYLTTFSFGASPQLRQLEAVINLLGQRTSFGYYPTGLVQYRQDALGNRTSYTWTSQGVKATEVDPLGHCRTYQRDLVGNMTVEIDPLGACWTHRYDQMWRQMSTEDPLGCRNTSQ
jgi:YD repeat-containing protein